MEEITILKKIENYYVVMSMDGETSVIDEETLKRLISYGKISNYKDFI
jgi:hypothetical protein